METIRKGNINNDRTTDNLEISPFNNTEDWEGGGGGYQWPLEACPGKLDFFS